jgi:hypothetical protein
MYYKTNDGFGDETGSYGAAVVAAPVAVGITAVAVLEAIALVATALAAAYLLIKAYEAAKARGFGVALAERLLTAGVRRLVSEVRRMLDRLRQLLDRARNIKEPRPDCASAISALLATFVDLTQALSEFLTERGHEVPRIPQLRAWMSRMESLLNRARSDIGRLVRACGSEFV